MPQKWNVKRTCKNCHKIFYARKHDVKNDRGIYCSWKCSDKSKKTSVTKKCLVCSKAFEAQPNEIKRGFGKFCSMRCFLSTYRKTTKCELCGKQIQNRVKKCRKCHLASMPRGEENNNWRGGITPENMTIRNSKRYKKWRDNIFKRDEYICQECGQVGGTLHAHHIRAFSIFPKLRFKKSNGITLCKKCHDKYPKRIKEKRNAQN